MISVQSLAANPATASRSIMQFSDFKFGICIIYFLSMLVPSEMFFEVAGVRFEIYRFILIFSFFVFAREMIEYAQREKVVKYLLAYVAICALALFYNHGLASLESIFIHFLEVYVGFFIGMSVAADPQRFKILLKVVCIGYILLIPFAIVESQNGYRILHVWAADISGNYFAGIKGSLEYLGDSYYRYGLHRASTVFSHPILYSVVAACTIPLVFLTFGRSWWLWSIGLFVALVTSVTSAGILMVIMFFGMRFLKSVSKFYPSVYKHILYVVVAWFFVVLIFSNRGPIPVLIDLMAINPETGYARYLQWEYASDDVRDNLLFGIGFKEWSRPWWMSASVDNYWLMVALRFGCVALVTIAAVYITNMVRVWKLYMVSGALSHYMFFTCLLQLAFAGVTVHFFDRAALYVFMMLGVLSSFIIAHRIQLLDWSRDMALSQAEKG